MVMILILTFGPDLPLAWHSLRCLFARTDVLLYDKIWFAMFHSEVSAGTLPRVASVMACKIP